MTSNGIKNRKVEEKQKSMRQEAKKFENENFKRRKSREKPRKGREIFNENHHEGERNRARDKTLTGIYNG